MSLLQWLVLILVCLVSYAWGALRGYLAAQREMRVFVRDVVRFALLELKLLDKVPGYELSKESTDG